MTDETEPQREACDRCGAYPGFHQPVDSDCRLTHSYGRDRHPPKARIGHLCRGCVDRHKDWLGEIVELYALLPQVVLAGSIPDDTAAHKHPKKAPASPSPIRLDAWSMLYDTKRLIGGVRAEDGGGWLPGTGGANLPDVPNVLCAWAQLLADATTGATTADTVSGAATALRIGAETMAHQPEVDEYDAELAWLRRALRNAHGLPARPQDFGECLTVIPEPCRGRVIRETTEQPHCKRCKRIYSHLDLVRLKISTEMGDKTA